MEITISRERVSNHLSRIVDAESLAPIPPQSAQVPHPHAIRTSDEGASHHLPGIVDAVTPARAQVPHPHAIRTGDEGMGRAFSSDRISHHLPGIVDVESRAGMPA